MRLAHSYVFALLLLTASTGCHFSAGIGSRTTQTQTQTPVAAEESPQITPEPRDTIRGNWSEPVNGIRMAVFQAVPGHAEAGQRFGGVNLVLAVQNVSDQSAYLPHFRPELERRFGALQDIDEMVPDVNTPNLRIITEPLDGQGGAVTSRCFMARQQMRSVPQSLAPGEMRLFIFQMYGDLSPEQVDQNQHVSTQNQIEGFAMLWPSLEDASGRWRITLVYRPDGFRAPYQTHAVEDSRVLSFHWEDQQVVVPPIDLNLIQDGELHQLDQVVPAIDELQ